jgi:hypothetical protein
MSTRKRTTWRAAFTLALAAVCLAPAVGAQTFTDNIEIASHHPTLQAAIDAAGEGGMLIVDQNYDNLAPLVLPRRFRMTGKGPQGNAWLAFQGLAAGSAITIAPDGDAYVTIEDLDIEGPFIPYGSFATTARGIDLTGASIVFLRRLVVRGFYTGVYGQGSLSVHADECNVSVSRSDNYMLTAGSNSWRITGGLSSWSGRYGINVIDVNDTLIQGVRMESNSVAAISTNANSTHIANNRFECWVDPKLPFCQVTTRAVDIGPAATQTTLVDNLYSGIGVVDSSVARTTYRFDNGYAVEISPPAGVSPLSVRTAGATRLMVSSTGNVGVGTSVPTARLQVGSGDAYISTIGNGVILRSPSGSCFRLTVSNAGVLGAAAVACP